MQSAREGKDLMGEEHSKAKEAEAKMRQQEAEDERAAPVLMTQGDHFPTGATVPLSHVAAPGHFQHDPTNPPTNAALKSV